MRLPILLVTSLLTAGIAHAEAPMPAAKESATKESVAKAKPAVSSAASTLCEALEAAARRNNLPNPFFARLIWQESHFNPLAVSPKGAQGVAQFMPGTAAERGLLDPFEPARALDESAAYLKELRARFGNLGLAAAAYNGGPGRVSRWLAGETSLPSETIDYVETVTGHSVEAWRGPFTDKVRPPTLPAEPDFSCVAFAGDAGRRRMRLIAAEPEEPGATPAKPWAMILVGSFNKAAVIAEWQIMRAKYAETLGPLTPSFRRRHLGGLPARKYVVQIESSDRASSARLCHQLEKQGGNCVVLRNMLR